MSSKKISKYELLMIYFEGNIVLGLLMIIKAQIKAKICYVNCDCCVAGRTCFYVLIWIMNPCHFYSIYFGRLGFVAQKYKLWRIKVYENHKRLKVIKAKLKNIVKEAEARNKNLKRNEHKTLDGYVTPRMVLLPRGKVCNIPQSTTGKWEV